jgi:hypothetical protein
MQDKGHIEALITCLVDSSSKLLRGEHCGGCLPQGYYIKLSHDNLVVPLVRVFTLVSVESPVITVTPDSWWRLHEEGMELLRGLLRRNSILSGFSRIGSLSIRIVHDDLRVNRFVRRSK